jgi:hypothetical protein
MGGRAGDVVAGQSLGADEQAVAGEELGEDSADDPVGGRIRDESV